MKSENPDEIRRLRGDGLTIKMEWNKKILEITGDACRINLTKNCGRLLVVGDACRLKVLHNSGEIIYRGDGGRVLLGPESPKDGVKYVGDGGKIIFDLDLQKQFARESKETPEQRKQKKNDVNDTCKRRCDVSPSEKRNLFDERRKHNAYAKIEDLNEAVIFLARNIVKECAFSAGKEENFAKVKVKERNPNCVPK